MKKRFLTTTVLGLMLSGIFVFQSVASEEKEPADYSFLEEMSIKELKELDNEIHKLLPRESVEESEAFNDAAMEEDIVGIWCAEILYDDYFSNNTSHQGHQVEDEFEFYEAHSGDHVASDPYYKEDDPQHEFVWGKFNWTLKSEDTVELQRGLLTESFEIVKNEEGKIVSLLSPDGKVYTKRSKSGRPLN